MILCLLLLIYISITRPQRLETAKLCEAEFVLFLCGTRNLLSSSEDASPRTNRNFGFFVIKNKRNYCLDLTVFYSVKPQLQ